MEEPILCDAAMLFFMDAIPAVLCAFRYGGASDSPKLNFGINILCLVLNVGYFAIL